jgi:CRISPR-associated protein Cas1
VSNVYVEDSSAVIGFSENRITVKTRDGVTRSLPIESVDAISVFGNAQITTQCIGEAFKRGIGIYYYSSKGKYFGRLSSTEHVNTRRQKSQAALSEDSSFRLSLSKRIISAKLNNQAVLLKRYLRTASPDTDIKQEFIQLQSAQRHTEFALTLEELIGHEGSGAKAYFSALSKMVEPDFRFEGRSRRPPKDAFNSMISLGYSLLLNAVIGAIEMKGLNPYFGFLHSDRERHPTLASDLMEEWRAVIVDSTVMSLVNGHEISTDEFSRGDDGGVYISKNGMKVILKKLEAKFMAKNRYLSYADYPISFRRAIELQVGELAKAIESGNHEQYSPIRIR